ncbi:Transcriptional regulatory protein LevR, contains PRD, AAA+ and EIIA domains [Clostridium frigidicarnis]|uniref:Transcriptional regulatory protein LevR, contains PRD, AAA+ and EIIA domains n=1 Tax=Clostridium frigidicarnis TaxID=84698 RepID=A0A1I0YBY3_9CLOT|nr:Transcriptional regulatory protein LevR, contains PRD, AAA+ and EIIA domains [Clostridium frigidicarnis]
MSQKNGGNIGSLKNVVKFCCALAYKEQQNEKIIKIDKNHLRTDELNFNQKVKQYYFQEFMKVNREDHDIREINPVKNERYNRLYEMVEVVETLLTDYQKNIISIGELRKKLTMELNRSLDIIVYHEEKHEENDLISNIYLETVENTLKIMESTYGIKYYGNTSKILTKVLLFFRNNIDTISNDYNYIRIEKIKNIIGKELSKSLVISEKIINNLESNLDYELNTVVQVIMILYVFTMMSTESTSINAIIVAHGYSTASSISSVANQLYGEFIFEAFDMPIDIGPSEVKDKIKNYLSKVDTSKGTIILVDMGSLININSELEEVLEGDLGVINNITTNIALDIAGRIINGEDVENMITGIEKNNPLMCKFIKSKEKKKAILTTCISGIGTAKKLKKLLKECIGDADIEIKEYDYASLNLKGKDDKIFSDYDVKLIITTTKLEIDGVKSILLHDLINGDCDEIFFHVLKDVTINKNIDNIKQDIIKMFSMDNLISRLTILNPNKIINEVETIIVGYERTLDKRFNVDLKITLYIHTSILIERLMLKQGLTFIEEEELKYKEENSNFIRISQDIFKGVIDEYNLEIPLKEIYIIQSIIESRIGKLGL